LNLYPDSIQRSKMQWFIGDLLSVDAWTVGRTLPTQFVEGIVYSRTLKSFPNAFPVLLNKIHYNMRFYNPVVDSLCRDIDSRSFACAFARRLLSIRDVVRIVLRSAIFNAVRVFFSRRSCRARRGARFFRVCISCTSERRLETADEGFSHVRVFVT